MSRFVHLAAVSTLLARVAIACPACAAGQASQKGHLLWPLVLAMMFIPFALALGVTLLLRRKVDR